MACCSAAMALRVGAEIVKHGRIRYSALGVGTEDAPSTEQQPQPGARVTRVIAGGPAEQAGLRRGDVITAVDGEAIADSAALDALVLTRAVGTKLKLDVRRGKRSFLTQAKTADADQLGPASGANISAPDAVTWGGLTMVDATPNRLTQMGIVLPPDTREGVLVLDVAPDSAAATSGLIPGDVLLKVHNSPLTGVDDLLKSVDNQPVVLVAFWRGTNRYLAVLAIGD